MKRTELKRKTALRSTKPIARGRAKALDRTVMPEPKPRTRVKPKNDERRAIAYARNYGGPDGRHADVIRSMPCACTGRSPLPEHDCWGRTVAAHEDPRGMGGRNGGWADLVNLCHRHHLEAGERRTSERDVFKARYKIDLRQLADDLAKRYMPDLITAWAALSLGGYDLDALLGWIHRRMQREVEHRAYVRKAHSTARRTEESCGAAPGRFGCVWDGLPDLDRGALSWAVFGDLGVPYTSGPGHLAWELCEAAGWPS